VELAPNTKLASFFNVRVSNLLAEGFNPLGGGEVVEFVGVDANSFVAGDRPLDCGDDFLLFGGEVGGDGDVHWILVSWLHLETHSLLRSGWVERVDGWVSPFRR